MPNASIGHNPSYLAFRDQVPGLEASQPHRLISGVASCMNQEHVHSQIMGCLSVDAQPDPLPVERVALFHCLTDLPVLPLS
jgi:hypothetical protein